MALISTSGAQDADSYVASTTEADTIAATLASVPLLAISTTGFAAMTTAAKEYVLKMAADRIDRLNLDGVKATELQAREFPRINTRQVRYENTIPDAVKHAQVAEACALATAPTGSQIQSASGVSSFTVSEESVTFSDRAIVDAARPVSAVAERILADAGLTGRGAGSVYVLRG